MKKARVRHRKQERIQRQSNDRIIQTLSSDQRNVLALSHQGYAAGEIARELALTQEYVRHFVTSLVQRLTHEHLIPSPDWHNVLLWAISEGIIDE